MSEALTRLVEKAAPMKATRRMEQECEALREQVDAADALLQALYPIERAARARVEKLAEPLRERFRALARILTGLPRVSLEPLSWRRADGWPTLAVVPIGAESVRYRVKVEGFGDFDDDFKLRMEWRGPAGKRRAPKIIRRQYRDLFERFVERDRRGDLRIRIKQIEAKFSGVIPAPVRAKVERFAPLFDDVVMITEPASWTVTVPKPDPVVAGWGDGSFWIIDTFDVTPAEEAFAALGERFV